MRIIPFLTALCIVFVSTESQTTPLSDKLSLPRVLGTAYKAMDIITSFDTLYTNDVNAAENNAQLAHYLSFGKLKDGVAGFIPPTSDYLIRTGPKLTTAEEKATIFKLLLKAAHRTKPKDTALSTAFNALTLTGLPPAVAGHTKGARNYAATAEMLIKTPLADVGTFAKRAGFDPKTVLAQCQKEGDSFDYMGQVMKKFADLDVPVAQYPFISRLLPKEQVKKILEVNLWLRQLQKWQRENPEKIEDLIQEELTALQSIEPANRLWMTVNGVGRINLNLMHLRRDDIFEVLTPDVLLNSSKIHADPQLSDGVTLFFSFLNYAIPLIGYNITQNYIPKDISIHKSEGSIVAKGENSTKNIGILHKNLADALDSKNIDREEIDISQIPDQLTYDWRSLKEYFLILKMKISDKIQERIGDSGFKKTSQMNGDKDDLGTLTTYNAYCTEFRYPNRLNNTPDTTPEPGEELTLEKTKTEYLLALKKLSQLSCQHYHDLDTYHLMWMIKLKIIVDKEKINTSDPEKTLLEKITEKYSRFRYGLYLEYDTLTQEYLDRFIRFWNFIETFTPDNDQEAADFVVVMKQLIPRLEYGLQLRMVLDGNPNNFVVTPMDFWRDLA